MNIKLDAKYIQRITYNAGDEIANTFFKNEVKDFVWGEKIVGYLDKVHKKYDSLGKLPKPYFIRKTMKRRDEWCDVDLPCWYIPKSSIVDLKPIPYSYTNSIWLVSPSFKIVGKENIKNFIGTNYNFIHFPAYDYSPLMRLFITTMDDHKYDDYIMCLDTAIEELDYLTKKPWYLLKSNTKRDIEKQLDDYIINNVV